MTFTQEMPVAAASRLAADLRHPPVSTAEGASNPAAPADVHLRRIRSPTTAGRAQSTVLVGDCADAVMNADLAHGSLHETLGRAGCVLRRGSGTIAAAAATAEDARLLGIRTGDPLLVERRVISDGNGRRIEATESRYPADRYALLVAFDVEAPDMAAAEVDE
jgi:GntR family transcriptional regulator